MILYLLFFVDVLGYAWALLKLPGSALLAFLAAQVIGALLFGKCADLFGKKRTLWITLSGTGLGNLIALTPLLLIGRGVAGLFSATLPICLAAIAKGKQGRGKRISLAGALLGATWVVALLTYQYVPFWCVPLTSCAGLALLLLLKKEERVGKPSALPHRHLRPLLFAFFFWTLGMLTIKLHMYLSVAVAWTIASLLVLLIKRISIWTLILWSVFFNALFLFFSEITTFHLYFLITANISLFAAALVWRSSLTLIALCVNEYERCYVMGMTQALFACSQIVAIQPLHYAAPFFILISFVLLLVNLNHRKNKRLLWEKSS